MILENISTTLVEIRDELRKLNSGEKVQKPKLIKTAKQESEQAFNAVTATNEDQELTVEDLHIQDAMTAKPVIATIPPVPPVEPTPVPTPPAPPVPAPVVTTPESVATRVLEFEELSKFTIKKSNDVGFETVMACLDKYGVSKLKDLKKEDQAKFVHDLNNV